ncbi:RNA-directed DNA polymerase from mobile element jockey, partial [Aphis craccivora]
PRALKIAGPLLIHEKGIIKTIKALKAFDTIYHIILLNNFNKLYIKGMVNNLISLYLKNKKHVRINVELSVHQITTQYPTLFNLYYKIKPRFFVTHTNLHRSTYSHQTFNCYTLIPDSLLEKYYIK